MALYTSSYLRNVSQNVTLNESQKFFSNSKAQTTFDIFLSHSFLDKEDVKGLYFELTRMGFKVYVDWIVDPQLDRTNVTKESATLVRNRLRSSKSLLLAISINATLSKWIPWELGWIDGHTSNCAIVPISNSPTPPNTFRGTEYLSLYPFITQASDTNFIRRLWVAENINQYVRIDEWINGGKPTFRSRNLF